MSKVRSLGYQLATFMRCVVSNLQPKTYNLARGFTLVELLVVIAIITFLAAAVLYTGRAQQGEREVTNAAYDLVSLIREAQTYGGAVQETSKTSNEYKAYGVEVVKSTGVFTLFADSDDNDQRGGSEALSSKTLSGGISVSAVCYQNPSGGEVCNRDILTAVYGPGARDADIHVYNGSYSGGQGTAGGRIELSTGVFTRSVVVSSAGAVSVQ